MYAVIRVYQNYDDVESLEYVTSFKEEQDAENYVQKVKEDCKKATLERLNYIKEYVDKIQMPSSNEYYDLKSEFSRKYLDQYRQTNYVPMIDFKSTLHYKLMQGYITLEDCKPPPIVSNNVYNLFIVEIASMNQGE